jgi:peroxiredoxin
MRKWMLPAVTAVLAVALVSYTNAGDKEGKQKKDKDGSAAVSVGQPAPLFTLQDQDGQTVNLADFQDKVVVLEWFNNDCPYVVKFYKNGHMNKWAQKYAEKDVVWLAVNTTSGRTNESNKSIANEWKIERPILNDAEGRVGQMYGATNTPHMYVINRGTLVYMGAIDSNRSSNPSDIEGATNYVAKALDEVLAGQSVSEPRTKAYGCSIKYSR